MNARPHPGPLPQERVNCSPLSGDKNGVGARTHFRASLSEAAIAAAPENFPGAAAVLSLSPGKRAGVRASVPLIFFPPRTHRLCVTRQRPRRARLQLPEDRIANYLSVAPELRVPKPQDLDAQRSEELLPIFVMFPLFWKPVLSSIQFNRQPRLFTEEIERVFSDRMLSAEFVAAEPSRAQPAPHEFLGPGRLFPQSASGTGIVHERQDGNSVRIK